MVELIWDSKRTAPPRLKLPFQTVQTINESAQQRQMSLDLFGAGHEKSSALFTTHLTCQHLEPLTFQHLIDLRLGEFLV